MRKQPKMMADKPTPKPPEPDVMIHLGQNESRQRGYARTMLRPTLNTAITVRTVLKRTMGDVPDLTISGVMEELADQCAKVSKGNLARPEAMLTTQAHTLDALFHDITRLAYQNMNNFDVAERLFRLAFRAQGQSRATLETLAVIKNPPMVFAKQANIANGPQQVNNGVPRARDELPGQNKLLEQTHGERLETGTASSAGRSDKEMETVGAFNRTENGGR